MKTNIASVIVTLNVTVHMAHRLFYPQHSKHSEIASTRRIELDQGLSAEKRRLWPLAMAAFSDAPWSTPDSGDKWDSFQSERLRLR
jgi:hypothetical protein